MDAALPSRLDDFTGPWLTTALRESGTIGPQTSVESVELTVLGHGEGFVGEIGRLALGYEGPPGPASMVAKIPTVVEENRAAGQLLGVYEREVRVYSELLSTLDVPVPRVYLAAMDADPTAPQQLERMKKVDRLPLWVLRRLLRAERRQVIAPDAVLLLEDLCGYEPGDQVEGCDLERAAHVMGVAARFHASSWGLLLPAEKHWLQPGDVVPRLFHASFLDSRKGFARLAEPDFSDHSKALFKRIRKEGLGRIRSLHQTAPRCVLHGDFRLDNMFFSPDGSVRAVIDWQIPNLGPAVLDLAYFITGSLARETSEAEVDELLVVYHDALMAAGPEDYPIDWLRADYDEALLVLLHRLAALETMEFGDQRGAALISGWLRRFDARLARIPA